MTNNSGWRDFLEEQANWPTAYQGYQNWPRTPNQKKYFQGQFANVQNQFMGQQARQIMGGGIPNLTFTDFLARYFAPQGGATQEWARLTPSQRGENPSLFNPRTQRLFW